MKHFLSCVALAALLAWPTILPAQPGPAPAAPPPDAAAATNALSTAQDPAVEPAPATTPAEQPKPPGPAAETTPPPAAPVADTNNPAAQQPETVIQAPENASGGTNGLRLNFRGVPLDMVLNYLSEAAGFIIVLEAQPRGKVDVFSKEPLTREEAVDLLNSVLNRNGYAAIRRGRTLTIVNRDEAKIKAIPVKSGSDPEGIPENDEIVTQIIPVRYVEVTQLIKDLQPLVSVQTAMTANESGNSIIITDTQANIRKVAEVIKAIDMGAEDVTVVRVFRLTYSDPAEMADLLTSLFPDETRSGGSGSSSPVQFGGFRRLMGAFGGGGGGGASAGSGNQNQRIKKRARVLAVPDPRTSSVIVSSTRDLMDQIEGVVQELDANPAKKQTVKVYQLQNADPQEAMQVLQDIFQKSGTQNSRNSAANQTSIFQNRSTQQQNQQNTSSTRQGTTSRGRTGVGTSTMGR
jgi:general secretion pathway protein D